MMHNSTRCLLFFAVTCLEELCGVVTGKGFSVDQVCCSKKELCGNRWCFVLIEQALRQAIWLPWEIKDFSNMSERVKATLSICF